MEGSVIYPKLESLGVYRISAQLFRHEAGRIVQDGDTITAGGVTAGIDFGFAVIAEVAGRGVAESVQLALEYDPHPPFDAGTPDRAEPAIVDNVAPRYVAAAAHYAQRLETLGL